VSKKAARPIIDTGPKVHDGCAMPVTHRLGDRATDGTVNLDLHDLALDDLALLLDTHADGFPERLRIDGTSVIPHRHVVLPLAAKWLCL